MAVVRSGQVRSCHFSQLYSHLCLLSTPLLRNLNEKKKKSGADHSLFRLLLIPPEDVTDVNRRLSQPLGRLFVGPLLSDSSRYFQTLRLGVSAICRLSEQGLGNIPSKQ